MKHKSEIYLYLNIIHININNTNIYLQLGYFPDSNIILFNFDMSIIPGKKIRIAPGSLILQMYLTNFSISSNERSSVAGFRN